MLSLLLYLNINFIYYSPNLSTITNQLFVTYSKTVFRCPRASRRVYAASSASSQP